MGLGVGRAWGGSDPTVGLGRQWRAARMHVTIEDCTLQSWQAGGRVRLVLFESGESCCQSDQCKTESTFNSNEDSIKYALLTQMPKVPEKQSEAVLPNPFNGGANTHSVSFHLVKTVSSMLMLTAFPASSEYVGF